MVRLRTVLQLLLVCAAVVASVYLITEWVNVGRKDTNKIEVKAKKGMVPPHLFFNAGRTGGCGIKNVTCQITLNGTSIMRNDLVTEIGIEESCKVMGLPSDCNPRQYCDGVTPNDTRASACSTYASVALLYFNSTQFEADNLRLTSSFSDLVAFIIQPRDDGCQKREAFRMSAQAIDVISLYNMPPDLVSVRGLGVPTPVGIGSDGFLNFKITERQFKNGSVVTRNDIQTTQYKRKVAPRDPSAIYIEVRVASFNVVRNVEIAGTSIIHLLGSVFGWWNILIGACIVTFYDFGVSAVKQLHNEVGPVECKEMSQDTDSARHLDAV